MAIVTAAIEANGWVLRLKVSGSPGSFAGYTLDPDGTSRVTLSSSHPGFVQSAGTAVAGTLARSLVATKPLRKPVDPANPTTPVIDETDNGDGTVTVRLALSGYVHATDTAVTLTVLAGWRTGEGAASGIAVGNGSTFAAALPIFRWADVPYLRATGSITLELVAFSHHPVGLQPVAGVKFTVTDGTTVKTAWATALSTSAKYGDAVRVYTVTIDPAAATALTAGLLRCDAEVHPWLGAMRSTDPAGTRSMTGLDLAGHGDGAQTPFVVGYDPAGTRYGQVLYVDPVGGTTTAAAAMVKADLASAKALAAASRPKDVTTALQALYLANRTLTAANGQASRSRSADGARIVLAVGTHASPGATAVTTGLTSAELAVQIEGDPDDANPRANCILQTGTAANFRITKVALANLSFELAGTALAGNATIYWRFDNVEVRGKAGSEASNVGPVTPTVPAGLWNMSATRVKWWKTGSHLYGGTSLRFGLIRGCEASRKAEGLCILAHRFIAGGAGAEDSFQTASEPAAVGGWTGVASTGAAEDVIVAGCDLRYIKDRAWTPVPVAAATAGTPNQSYRRLVFANTVCEKINSVTLTPFWSMGEDELATISYNLIEGSTFVGERSNCMYADPPVTTVADTNTLVNQAHGNRVANCSFDWLPTKHDAFNDGQSAAVRTAASVGTTGYRPQLTEAWSITYGVGWEGVYDWGRHPSANNFDFEYLGRRGVKVLAGTPAWAVDRCNLSGGTTSGGGTYKPPAGSPLIGRALRGSSDRDQANAVRTVPFASGAIETPPPAAAALAPAGALEASRSGIAAVAWGGLLTAAPARSLSRAGVAGLFWAGALAAAGSPLSQRAGLPAVQFAAGLSPAAAAQAETADEPVITIDSYLLAAAGSVASLTDIGVAVLPDLIFATPRLVRIEGEVRVELINQD